jgi:hypothetical protein
MLCLSFFESKRHVALSLQRSTVPAEVVASHFQSRNVTETVFYLARTRAGGFVAPAADGRSSIVIQGRLPLTQLLAHPQVKDLPWVRLVFGAPGEAPQPSIEAIEEDDWASLVGNEGNEGALAPKFRLEPGCATSFFMQPTPRLQHRLLTGPLPEMDATRVAGRGIAALHIRTGYADVVGAAGATQHELLGVHRLLDAGTAAQPALALTGPPMGAAEAWRLLDGLVVRCTAQHSNVTPTLPGCFEWPEETQRFMDSAGAACAKKADGSALEGLAVSGSPVGFFSMLMRCAAAAAADYSHQGAPPAVYVAGDLPALHALVAHDSALRGSAFAAQTGSVGHVSSSTRCSSAAAAASGRCLRGRDPGGAWTRTMVDAYMISVCDVVVSHGQSVFVSGFVEYRVPGRLPRLAVTAVHREVNGGNMLFFPPLLHAQSDAISARLVAA